jgi:uncharacterized membrane protein YsdA (DUF1294 family)
MGSNLWLITLAYFVGINLATFLIYRLDKYKAKHRSWRIPERTLLFFAWIGGCVGALLGMWCFHHKTRKLKFCICVPLALIFWLCLMGLLVFCVIM